jgi:hypothetical protein
MEHELRENNRKQRPLKCHVINLSFDAFCVRWDVGHFTLGVKRLSRNILGSILPLLGKIFHPANQLKIKYKLSTGGLIF